MIVVPCVETADNVTDFNGGCFGFLTAFEFANDAKAAAVIAAELLEDGYFHAS